MKNHRVIKAGVIGSLGRMRIQARGCFVSWEILSDEPPACPFGVVGNRWERFRVYRVVKEPRQNLWIMPGPSLGGFAQGLAYRRPIGTRLRISTAFKVFFRKNRTVTRFLAIRGRFSAERIIGGTGGKQRIDSDFSRKQPENGRFLCESGEKRGIREGF